MNGTIQRKSLASVSLYQSFPPYNGGSSRIINLAKQYSSYFDVSIYGQSLRNLIHSKLIRVSDTVRELQAVDLSSFIGSLACRTFGVPQLLQRAAFRISAPTWLRDIVTHASVVVIEQPWQARWVQESISGNCALVYDAHNVELEMFKIEYLRGPTFLRKRLLTEIKNQEGAAVRASDLVVVTSDRDKQRMIALYGCVEEKIHVAANGVDTSEIAPRSASERECAKQELGLTNRKTVIFLGARHPPNKKAVESLLEIAKMPECQHLSFIIVGAVSTYFPNHSASNVRFTGFVKDPAPYFTAADIAVNPVETGGGSSLKQVEYMARGLPTVVTPFGARGFDVVDGENAIIRDPQNFLGGIILLAGNIALAADIGRRARQSSLKYDWENIGRRLTDRLASICEAKCVSRDAA